MACPSIDYCYTPAYAASLPEPVTAHFFLFRRELPSKSKRRMDFGHKKCGSLQKQLDFVFFPDKGRVFCFGFLSLRLSFITCLHDLQTTYTLSGFGAQAREAIRSMDDTGKQRKQAKNAT